MAKLSAVKRYQDEKGQNYTLANDGRWYLGNKPFNHAVFCSRQGYNITKDATERKTIGAGELIGFGNDPFRSQGYLFYIGTTESKSGEKERKLMHSGLLTKIEKKKESKD